MLNVDVIRKQGSVTVLLSGELDCAEELPCRQALELGPSGPHQRFVIDLSGVTFMDSTGIKLLLLADNCARVKGLRRPVIRGAGPRVRKILDTTGVTSLLNIEDRDSVTLGVAGSSRRAEHPSRWGRAAAAPRISL